MLRSPLPERGGASSQHGATPVTPTVALDTCAGQEKSSNPPIPAFGQLTGRLGRALRETAMERDSGDLEGTGDSRHANDCLKGEDGPDVRSDLGYLGAVGKGRYK